MVPETVSKIVLLHHISLSLQNSFSLSDAPTSKATATSQIEPNPYDIMTRSPFVDFDYIYSIREANDHDSVN